MSRAAAQIYDRAPRDGQPQRPRARAGGNAVNGLRRVAEKAAAVNLCHFGLVLFGLRPRAQKHGLKWLCDLALGIEKGGQEGNGKKISK